MPEGELKFKSVLLKSVLLKQPCERKCLQQQHVRVADASGFLITYEAGVLTVWNVPERVKINGLAVPLAIHITVLGYRPSAETHGPALR